MQSTHKIVIIGAEAAGITVAAGLNVMAGSSQPGIKIGEPADPELGLIA